MRPPAGGLADIGKRVTSSGRGASPRSAPASVSVGSDTPVTWAPTAMTPSAAAGELTVWE